MSEVEYHSLCQPEEDGDHVKIIRNVSSPVRKAQKRRFCMLGVGSVLFAFLLLTAVVIYYHVIQPAVDGDTMTTPSVHTPPGLHSHCDLTLTDTVTDFRNIHGVTVTNSDVIIVTDLLGNEITLLDIQGQARTTLHGFFGPSGVTSDGDSIYIAASLNRSIIVLTSDGRTLQNITCPGHPKSVTIDKTTRELYARIDRDNGGPTTIMVFSPVTNVWSSITNDTAQKPWTVAVSSVSSTLCIAYSWSGRLDFYINKSFQYSWIGFAGFIRALAYSPRGDLAVGVVHGAHEGSNLYIYDLQGEVQVNLTLPYALPANSLVFKQDGTLLVGDIDSESLRFYTKTCAKS